MIHGYDPNAGDKDSEGGSKPLFANYRATVVLPAAASEHAFDVPVAAAKSTGN